MSAPRVSLWLTRDGPVRPLQRGRVPTGQDVVVLAEGLGGAHELALELRGGGPALELSPVRALPGQVAFLLRATLLEGARQWVLTVRVRGGGVALQTILFVGTASADDARRPHAPLDLPGPEAFETVTMDPFASHLADDEDEGDDDDEVEADDEPADDVAAPRRCPSSPSAPRGARRAQVGPLALEAFDHAGEPRPAAGAIAADVARVEVRGLLEGTPPPAETLSLCVEDPRGRRHELPVRVARRRTRYAVLSRWSTSDLGAPDGEAPLAHGTWTLSLIQAGHGVLRRLRVELAPTPLRVRTASVLRLGAGAPEELALPASPDALAGRLVFAYALEGCAPDAPVEARLTLRRLHDDALVGVWVQSVPAAHPPDEATGGDALATPRRVLFPLDLQPLGAPASGVLATLALAGVDAHTQRLPTQGVAIRTDGTLAVVPLATPDGARVADALNFFGAQPRRRRTKR